MTHKIQVSLALKDLKKIKLKISIVSTEATTALQKFLCISLSDAVGDAEIHFCFDRLEEKAVQ